MTAHSKEILDGIMQREKPLGVSRRFESAHLPFSLAGRLMRDFGSIVGVPLHTVRYVAEDGSHGSRVASQFVGDDSQWFGALAPQESSKEPFCGTLITVRLDLHIDHVAVLVHGAELLTPLPDRFIGHHNFPLREKILYISEAQTEAMVRPDCIADNRGWKTIA
jgi:hypothetical protein